MIQFNPLTIKQWRRFRSIRRGYWSAVALVALFVMSSLGESLVNSRALMVSYGGSYYFPTYSAYLPGTTFGLDYEWETNYRELQEHFETQGDGN
ncbi:MAG: ABC transporter permease, partial [Gammaproteobacteria bacterium]|nr:ABC transporter permease [Gammaproteobacteria bacterium]